MNHVKKKKNHSNDDDSLHKELQSVKKDLDAARKANSKLEKELIDINNKQKPGTSSKLDRQLEEAKKKCSESSTELTSLKKDNTTAEKKIADLEKQTRKLND